MNFGKKSQALVYMALAWATWHFGGADGEFTYKRRKPSTTLTVLLYTGVQQTF
jgi:hypothetical protein